MGICSRLLWTATSLTLTRPDFGDICFTVTRKWLLSQTFLIGSADSKFRVVFLKFLLSNLKVFSFLSPKVHFIKLFQLLKLKKKKSQRAFLSLHSIQRLFSSSPISSKVLMIKPTPLTQQCRQHKIFSTQLFAIFVMWHPSHCLKGSPIPLSLITISCERHLLITWAYQAMWHSSLPLHL